MGEIRHQNKDANLSEKGLETGPKLSQTEIEIEPSTSKYINIPQEDISQWPMYDGYDEMASDSGGKTIGGSWRPLLHAMRSVAGNKKRVEKESKTSKPNKQNVGVVVNDDMEKVDDDVCIGDTVCLLAEETAGYVFSYQTSSVHNELAVASRSMLDRNSDPKQPRVRTSQSLFFKITAQNRYKANKRLPKIKAAWEMNMQSPKLKIQLTQAKKGAAAEEQDNNREQRRQEGKSLYYGQIIQMRHTFSNKYIHVNTTQTSWTESSNLMVQLLPENGKRAQFKILPRYKVKAEGDLVQVGDHVMLESVKSPGQYLHTSNVIFDDLDDTVYEKCHELNLSVTGSGFSLFRSKAVNAIKSDDTSTVTGASIVRLFHKEIEGYLTAEGVFGEHFSENVHLRLRPVSSSNHRSLLSPTNACTCWIIEKEISNIDGSAIAFEEQVRFQHLTTQQFLMVNQSLEVGLTPDRDNPYTVFRLHAATRKSDVVMHKTFLRIQHVLTSAWLHADRMSVYERRETSKDSSAQNIQWTKATLKKIVGKNEKMYNDAFSVELISRENAHDFAYIMGMVPFIQKLRAELEYAEKFSARKMHRMVTGLKEIKEFMVVNGVTMKQKQKLIREFKLADLLIDILHCSTNNVRSKDFCEKVHRDAYDILTVYLEGLSAKNELYLAKHFDFFQTQLSLEGVGLNATNMLMELLKNNRVIINFVTHDQIDMFIKLITKRKNYRYLELLSVLCIANEETLPENQSYIAKKWLVDAEKGGQNVVNYLMMGHEIGMEHSDIPYISTDVKKSWTPLADFVNMRNGITHEELKFFEFQLKLFSYLCRGRIELPVEVITTHPGFMSFDIAGYCLQKDVFSDEVRAVCAMNIRDLYIDVGTNHSLMDRVKLVFPYDKIGSVGSKTNRQSILSSVMPLVFVKPLKTWISEYLQSNREMALSLKSRSALNGEILHLVYSLVNFGYYGDTEEIQKLLSPMLQLIDGRNDKPFPIKSPLSEVEVEEIERFKNVKRFRNSPENTALCNSKIQAMRVVQLFFNFRFNTRLYTFISVFKAASEGFDELSIFLEEDIEFRESEKLHKFAKRRLHDIFQETEHFQADFIDILMDLLKYENSQLVTDALMLINQYYSAVETLFKGCIDTQILLTKDSLATMKKLEQTLPQFKMLKKSMQSGEANPKMVAMLKELSEYCSLRLDVRENHPLNQEMLYNYGIMSDTMEIVCRYTDANAKLEKHEQELIRYSLRLLKSLARSNDQVQRRLFERVDILLQVKGAEAELGETLIEVFNGNSTNSMKLSSNAINEIVELYKAHFHPVWLSLLTSLVISDRYPIKRNQGLVVKALMTYQETLSIITEKNQEDTMAILLDESKNGTYLKHQLCSLVYLFSICAAGENKSIESICQCLILMDELLNYINMKSLCNGLKLAFVNFMTTSYLSSSSPTAMNETQKYGNSERFITFLKSSIEVLSTGVDIIKRDSVMATDLLKQRPSNLHRSNGDVVHEMKENLHYIFDGLLPFIHAYFEKHWKPDLMETALYLLEGLETFAKIAHPTITRVYQRAQLLHTLRLVSHVTGKTSKIPDELLNRSDIMSEARKQYMQYYDEEINLNSAFDTFAENLKSAYEGRNTVRAQIGFPSDLPYINEYVDQPLPLGEQFQKLLSCFKVKYKGSKETYDINGIIKHLCSPLTFKSVNESMRSNLEELDIKCFKVLRAILHNEFARLPSNVSHNPELYNRVMIDIIIQQNALDDQGIIRAAIKHLARGNELLANETFSILNILYKNNKNTPASFVRHINEEHEEAFFVAVQARFLTATAFIKEQKYMVHMYLRTKMQNQSLLKAAKGNDRESKRTGSRRSKSPTEMLLSSFDKGKEGFKKMSAFLMTKTEDNSKQVLLPMVRHEKLAIDPEIEREASLRAKPMVTIQTSVTIKDETKIPPLEFIEGIEIEQDEDDEKAAIVAFQDINNVTVVLRTLQSLCDLEYFSAQQLLREQNRNVKSVNLVAEVCRFLSLIYTNVDEQYIDLVSDVIETIVEMIQGNIENQAVVFDNKVIDFVNHMLRVETFARCSDEQKLRLKIAIGVVIKLITEENQSPRGQMCQSKMIMAAVSRESVWLTAVDVHQYVNNEFLDKETKNQWLEMGFTYFCLVKRAVDMKLFTEDEEMTMKEQPAWSYYNTKTMSLECMKDGILQRVYFRVTDQKALRKDVEEKLKWEVDRSSHGNKMRDFMAWIRDIHDDIMYQRKIHSHFVGRFMVRRWKEFNYIIMLMTLVMNIGILVLWKESTERDNEFDNFWLYHHQDLDIYWRVLGVIHNLSSFCLVISYFLSNAAGFASSKRTLSNKIKMLNRLVLLSASVDPNDRPSKLETSIVGVQSMYYVAFFAFSLSGTIVSPAFYAFHLLQVVDFSQLLTRVIRAVTLNGKSLLWVALLGCVIIYIYGLIAFMTLREVIIANSHMCETLWECTATMIREGLIYRTMRIDYPLKGTAAVNTTLSENGIDNNNDFGFYFSKLAFDISFFIIILTIGLNVIFGIIVDTFRQLRDSKWRIEQDMETTCFVCARNSYEFEQKGISFRYHMTYEHNMLAYIFFFVRVQDMPAEDYSHLEMYVHRMVQDENYNFFPLNHAMSLDELDEQEAAVERDLIMMKQLDSIMKKLNQEESSRAKEAERLRQLEWHRQNKEKQQVRKSRVDFDSSSDHSILSSRTSTSAPSLAAESPTISSRKLPATATTISSNNSKKSATFRPLKSRISNPKTPKSRHSK